MANSAEGILGCGVLYGTLALTEIYEGVISGASCWGTQVRVCGGKLPLEAFKVYMAELCIAVDFIHSKHHAIHR